MAAAGAAGVEVYLMAPVAEIPPGMVRSTSLHGGGRMKIRITVLTENNRPRPEKMTEEMVSTVWQSLLNVLCCQGENEDKCTVEKVEFVEDK
jgi:hypothetical protein